MRWTPDEMALMTAHYSQIGADAMREQHLPHRTASSIRDGAMKFKLRYRGPRLGGGVAWSQAEIAMLCRLYPIGGATAVQAELPHRSIASIQSQAHKTPGMPKFQPGSVKRDDFAGTPVHDYTQPDVAVREWGRPADAPRLQLFGLVGVMAMEAAA